MSRLQALLTLSLLRVREDRERGDIPGWVMIAIMSAAVADLR